MKFISLFAGVGGFDLALERLGHECVYANEWDKYAVQTYEKNFRTKIDARDIRSVRSSEIPEHDLLCGGFPCQSFSIAGKRGGFNDTRGTLFFEIARILKDKRPTYLLLENVKGLLSHENGRTFETIVRTLDELGYDLQWQVLNSKNFGVPQNRERVFIVGHLRGTPRPEVFPIGEGNGLSNKKRQISATLDSNYHKGANWNRTFIKKINSSQDGKLSPLDGVLQTLSAGHYNQPKIAHTVRAGGRSSPHGSKQNWDSYEMEGKLRRLTPLECERLQGFPDNWTEGVSDTQRYKQMGNAVTVNVVYEIAKHL